MKPRKCKRCGTKFTPDKVTQLYCTKVCRNREQQKRLRQRAKETSNAH